MEKFLKSLSLTEKVVNLTTGVTEDIPLVAPVATSMGLGEEGEEEEMEEEVIHLLKQVTLLGDAPHRPTSPPICLRHLCIFLLIVASPRRNALAAPILESDDHVM